jgi:hypothetical protein
MCGDIETDESRGEELYERFVEHTRLFLAHLRTDTEGGHAARLHAYLDALFRETLRSTAEPDGSRNEVSGYERLSMVPLVYARVAGFMAAHQPLDEDPLRRLLEAMMTGYAEGEGALAAPDRSDDRTH